MDVNYIRSDLKDEAKTYVDANIWDGEDRHGCKGDLACFNPDELQELVNEVIDGIWDRHLKNDLSVTFKAN